LAAHLDDATAKAVVPTVVRLLAVRHTNYFARAELADGFAALAGRLSEKEMAPLAAQLAAGLRLPETINVQDGVPVLSHALAVATARLAPEARRQALDAAASDLQKRLAAVILPYFAADLLQGLRNLERPPRRGTLPGLVAPVGTEAAAAVAAGGPFRNVR